MLSALACLALTTAALPPEAEARLVAMFGLHSKDANQPALVVRTTEGFVSLPPGPMQADVTVAGFFATTRLKYTYVNPTDSWIEATFVHPVPEQGAVDSLRMIVGDRIIEGVIQEKAQAQKTYEAAKAAGKVAAVSHQLRPDLFSTAVANIPPKGNVTIDFGIRQILRYQDEAFEYRLPLAVNPRFTQPGDAADPEPKKLATKSESKEAGLESTIVVRLEEGLPLRDIQSPSHLITVRKDDPGTRVLVNRAKMSGDFVLRFTPDTQGEPLAASFVEHRAGHSYGALMVLPPAAKEMRPLPREMIFVVDTSGSMGGQAMVQAKAALQMALNHLSAQDSFEIVEFDSDVRAVFGRAVEASPENIERGRRAVQAMNADGGTMMRPALQVAFSTPRSCETCLRQVVFITDGAIGRGPGLYQLIRSDLKNARLFTVGIGSAPNARFMRKAAQAGRGSATFIANINEVEDRMGGLFKRLSRPAAANFVVDWGVPAETALDLIPDLYAGEALLVFARFPTPATTVSVRGQTGEDHWKTDLQPTAIPLHVGHGALGKLWARRRIEALMDSTAFGESVQSIRPAVTALALEHQLVSSFTSFVAVDVTPKKPSGEPLEEGVVGSHLASNRHGQSLPNGATSWTMWAFAGFLAMLVGLFLCRRKESLS